MIKNLFKKLEQHLTMNIENNKNEMLILTTAGALTPIDTGNGRILLLYQYAASVDFSTNVLSKEMGRIAFVFDNPKAATEQIKNNVIENLQLYHIKYSGIEETPIGKAYVVEKVIAGGNEIQNEQLETILYEYKNPKKLEAEIGEFAWDERFKCFRAELDWVDKKCYISLETSRIPDEQLGYKALENFKSIYAKKDICDANLREFIMKIIEERNIKSRMRGLEIDKIDVDCEGNYHFYYNYDMCNKITVSYFSDKREYGINIYNVAKADPNEIMDWSMFKL
ncbi:MAG: hypothetical protein E7252_05505 [Lachnospira sp.]|nr:hypothetical protein [Lachnospira sp.]